MLLDQLPAALINSMLAFCETKLTINCGFVGCVFFNLVKKLLEFIGGSSVLAHR